MATFTLLEYQRVTPSGEPVQPANARTTGVAFAAAQRLSKGTLYFEAIPDVDCYIRVSADGSAATTADPRAYANIQNGGFVDPNARPYVYLAVS